MGKGRIYIGTSGYSYKDWKGVFYPERMTPAGFLGHYAGTFPFVELNFSYYRQPDRGMLERMIEQTPTDFRFSIKAHRDLTHTRGEGWEQAAEKFLLGGAAPLREASRLAGILLQFPYSFHRDTENRRYLSSVTEYFSGFPLFVEFRNTDWQLDDVYSGLRERNIGIVNTDTPDLASLPENRAILTADRGYIRFHGRNSGTWWKGDNVSRYDYLYSPEELREWVERIRDMLKKVTVLYVAFNNHHKGQAVKNALQLREMLGA
jgi:uncharacterized protein YecE (DUF72 family)